MNKLLASIIRISCAVGALLVAAILSSCLWQRSLLYYPDRAPAATLLAPWEKDGAVLGYTREAKSPKAIWLMLHGNGGQAADRDVTLPHFPVGDAVYLLEYPGYGPRSGSPSRAAIDQAAQDGFLELRRRYPDKPIYVVGESIGSGPACYLCTLPQPPEKLFLVVPFDRLADVAAEKFSFLPVRLLLLDRWDNIAALRGYSGPVVIFGAKDDEVIPEKHARTLAQSHPGAVYHAITGGHNEWAIGTKVQFAP